MNSDLCWGDMTGSWVIFFALFVVSVRFDAGTSEGRGLRVDDSLMQL